jgi:hypothetical protein
MAGDEGDTQHGFDEWKQQLDAKEAELVAAQARLQQWEKRMAPVPVRLLALFPYCQWQSLAAARLLANPSVWLQH